MNIVRVKPGVRFDVITAAGLRLLAAIVQAAVDARVDLTISCGSDAHGPDDPHTHGDAYDVSVRDLTVDQILDLRHSLQSSLRDGFTVLYETPTPPADPRLAVIAYENPRATAPHVHVQLRNGWTYPPAPGAARLA
jgi:hypothetical protein